jgi:D-inositol-3-phosphate glycosyltransferase
MRIVMVGPVYPLRGGIAHYVSLLTQTLIRRGHEVKVITFKRQYPKILFPGKSQEETPKVKNTSQMTHGVSDANDTRDSSFKILNTEAILDSINPLTWIQAASTAAKFKPDLIIFNFWIPFMAPAYGVMARTARRLLRKQGHHCRIVCIAHNVIPHDKRPGDLLFTKFAFRAFDSFVVQAEIVERDLKAIIPNAKFIRLDHPVYDLFGTRMDRSEARRKLSIPADAPVILFFGYIRKYKGLDILLRAMPQIIEQLPEIRLIVAGEFYGDEQDYRTLIEELRIPSKNLLLVNDYIPNEEVPLYFSAANAAVVPYRSATQSGIVQIAYNFDVPVIATNVGGLPEIVKDGTSGLIAHDLTPEATAEKIIQFFQEKLETKLTRGVTEEKKKYSGDALAEGIEKM